jgi:hypothetical protein
MRVQGRHVARVSEVGSLDDGRAFLVMEHLDGCDLREALRVHGALPPTEAVVHVLEALEALAEAHAKQIVHRDLKPANLFLADQPNGDVLVKVLDFGISKLKDDSNALTKTFDVVGTPFYMAPEQLTNAKDVDERADIWSMGVILYELLVGQRPFEGRTMAEIIARVLRNDPPAPSTRKPDVPVGLDAVIRHCLSGDRNDRYDDVGELAEDLAPFAGPSGAERAARVVAARDRANTPRRAKVIKAAPVEPAPKIAVIEADPVRAKPARSMLTSAVVLVLLIGLAMAGWFWKKRADGIAAQRAVDVRLVRHCEMQTDSSLDAPVTLQRSAGPQTDRRADILAHLFLHMDRPIAEAELTAG